VSRPVSRRRRRRPKKKKWPYVILVIVILIGIGLTASVVLGYNPLLERQLRTQFGSEFFSDFGDLSPAENGDDLDSIVANYRPAFESLQDQAMNRLDDLLATALEEYYEQERSGTVDRFKLTNKYIQAGRILEGNVDATFYSLLDEMKAELEGNNLPLDVTTEISNTYEEAKADKKRELLDLLRQQVGE
jgi:hypothetical protein